MAWRPTSKVVAGELDNTTPGWTTGWIELQGRAEPLRLKLAGNCHPDLTGWKFRILRREPCPIEEDEKEMSYDGLATEQNGNVGDITAEQMLQEIDCSVSEFLLRCKLGDRPPTTLRKALYLEWFSIRNGRVVIQSTRLYVEKIGTRAFELSEAEWIAQARQNQEEMHFFMHQLGDALFDKPSDEDDGKLADEDSL